MNSAVIVANSLDDAANAVESAEPAGALATRDARISARKVGNRSSTGN